MLPNEVMLPLSDNPQNEGASGMATANVQAPTPCARDDHNRWNLALASDRLPERFSRLGQIRPVYLERTGSLGIVHNPEDLGGTPVRVASARMEKSIGSLLRRGTLCIKEMPPNARRNRLRLYPGNIRELPWSPLIHRRCGTRGGKSPFRLQLRGRCGWECCSRSGCPRLRLRWPRASAQQHQDAHGPEKRMQSMWPFHTLMAFRSSTAHYT